MIVSAKGGCSEPQFGGTVALVRITTKKKEGNVVRMLMLLLVFVQKISCQCVHVVVSICEDMVPVR
jgi:hypothetical protein